MAQRLEFSAAIGERLAAQEVFRRADLVLFYVSQGSEVETLAMRTLARSQGKTVAAPRCEVATRTLRFHVLGTDEALETGPHGISQPSASAPLARLGARSVVLVPGSVFDRQGGRMGMGMGYYDRWLAAEGQGLWRIGLAFHVQLVPEVPLGPLDLPVDCLLTERESLGPFAYSSAGRTI